MRFLAVAVTIIVALCLFLLGRPHPKPVDVAAVLTPSRPAASAMPVGAVVDDGVEPDEASLRRIEFATYAEIERRGGMPLMLSQTGQQFTIHPRLHDVHKDSCSKMPSMPGRWECRLTITLTLDAGEKPGTQGERVFVKRAPDGNWVGS